MLYVAPAWVPCPAVARCPLHHPHSPCFRAAAAEAQACGCPDALLRLLCSTPQPGTQAWPPAMSLVQALVGSWSRELELDAPVRLHHSADGCLLIREAKLSTKGEADVVWAGARLASAASPPACLLLRGQPPPLMAAALLGGAAAAPRPC